MKYSYDIAINTPPKRGITVEYSYGNIRGIKMTIGKRGVCIRFATGRIRASETMLTEDDALVMDAIKKVCLLFALVNSTCLEIRKISVSMNGELLNTEVFGKGHPLVYSMLSGDLGIQGTGLDDPVLLQQIANTAKSKNGRAEAALMAYLVAKTRTYRIERFIYLWMSVNAIYALAIEQAKDFMKTSTGKELKRFTEKDGLRLLAAMYNMDYPEIRRENEKRIQAHAFSLAKRKDPGECLSILNQTISGDRKRTDNIERYEVRPGEYEEYDWLALMLFWLPYRLRCHYFHSENTVPVFCYEDEKLLQGLAFVNELLEGFLSKELATWVIREKRESLLVKHAQDTAAGMAFGK